VRGAVDEPSSVMLELIGVKVSARLAIDIELLHLLEPAPGEPGI